MNRPNCPNCNGANPISKGTAWRCKICGSAWNKTYRGKFIKELGNRPNCPKCGKSFPSSHGHSWMCVGCGKQWLKINNPKDYSFYKDRPPCPHCGAYHTMIMGKTQFRCGECGKNYSENTLRKKEVRNTTVHSI